MAPLPSTTSLTRTKQSSNNSVGFLVGLYALCSSSLSIVNKWAILAIPYPSIVTACQFCTTSTVVLVLGKVGVLDVEPLETKKMCRMAPINVIFYLAIFTNGKLLQYSTVETFIAFRSLTPILVSCLDTVVRGEPAPSPRTILTLIAIAAGAASYARDDANFDARGYAWACAYLVIIVTEMVYAKHVTATIGLSTWGLVLYQNVIALTLAPVAAVATGELARFKDAATHLILLQQTSDTSQTPPSLGSQSQANALEKAALAASSSSSHQHLEERRYLRRRLLGGDTGRISPDYAVPIVASCVLAVGISFAGWGARSSVSATQFTVLGVACKLATVAINIAVWEHHAPLLAQLSILLCIFASVLYQQSAKKDKEVKLRKLATDSA